MSLQKKTARHATTKEPLTTLLDVVAAKSVSPEGWYKVTPTDDCTFEFYSHGKGRFQRARIRGKLEQDVMRELNNRVSKGMHVWDVGAAWGYFTQAIVSMGASVTAFEIDSDRCDIISEAAERNGWKDRVTAIDGAVGDDIVLDNYPSPDVVKMDIEGWEYEAIKGARETLSAGPTWIVEVHEPEITSDGIPARPGERMESLFQEHGYNVTYLKERSATNYHIVAEKI